MNAHRVMGYMMVLMVLLVTVVAGCTTPNLQWQGPKQYTPPPGLTVQVDGFSIDDQLDGLPNGDLPITFSRYVFPENSQQW